MGIRDLAVLAAMSAAIASPALAADAPVLAPSTDWTLDYDADSCALRRMFGTGDEQVFLELRRFGPGPALQAIVSSNRQRPAQNSGFRYRFGEAGEWRHVGLPITAKWNDGFRGVIFSPYLLELPGYDDATEPPPERVLYFRAPEFAEAEVAEAASVDTLTLSRGFNRELTLRLGSMAAPIAALNECVAELMTHWGIDVEAHKTLTRPAVPTNLPQIPRMMDYPPKMLQQRMPGLVNVRLDIDAAGLITECHIQMPLSDPAFEKSSCADIQHALEFDPALDKDGKPIASYYVTKVYFQIRT